MIRRNVLMLILVAAPWAVAEPSPVAPAKNSVKELEKKPFSLDLVIAPVLKNMAVPKVRANMVGEQLTVASSSEKARMYVKQGFALVHAQWDFEAYRCFSAALQEDPDCLMAYCGVTLALARPHNEYVAYRRAAVDRMLDLMESDKIAEEAGGLGRFPEVEKDFAAAVATLVSTSPRMAGAMFHQLGVKYPHFLQSQLLALFLSRGGYDAMGDPQPAQVAAVDMARAFLSEYSDNPMVIGFWLSLNAEASRSAIDFEKDLLPYARKLVELDPDQPTWHHVLGHYLSRIGKYDEAQKSFARSAELYAEWMKEEGVGVNDCAGYIKALCCQVNALYQAGRFDSAMKVAKAIREISLDADRPRSQGNAMLMWRGYNLQARLYIARGAKGDMQKGLDSLPKSKELSPFVSHPKYPTLAGVYNDALSIYLGCRKAIDQKDEKAAIALHRNVFRKHIRDLAEVSKGATQVSDYSHFLRAGNSLAIYDMELAGLIALHGPEKTRVVASGRFLSARDKQQVPTMMMPPMVLTPMDNRLAEYYLLVGDTQGALEAYQQGLARFANNVASLQGVEKSKRLLEKKEAAAPSEATN